MNIFDAHISGSLSVSSSAEISGNLTVLGTINATVSGTTTNALTASEAPKYTLTSSFHQFTSSYTTGSFTGSFKGDGTNLYNIPASGVTGLNLTQIADGVATASISNSNGLRVNSNTEITGALTISGSITLNGVPVGTGKLDETTFQSYTSSNDSTNTTQNSRLTSIEGVTGSVSLLNTYTSSNNTVIGTLQTSTGSLNTFTSSASGRLTSLESDSSSIRTDFNSFTSSNNTVETTQNGRLTSIEGVTGSIGSLNTYTGSNNTIIGTLQTSTSSLNTFTSSIDTTIKNKLNTETVISGSDQVLITGTTGYSTFSSSVSTSIGSLSSSVATTTSGLSSSIGSLSSSVETTTSGLSSSIGSLSSSVATTTSGLSSSLSSSIGSLSSSVATTTLGLSSSLTSSIGSLSSSVATTTSGLSSSIGSLSSSVATTTSGLSSSIGSLSSSIATTTLNQSNRLDSIEGKSGSYATTGSNTFKGLQTISGSVIITENLTVFGSSSITYVTSSQLRVEDNIITVNTASPGSRFGGLEVHDSGSVGIATGSLLWDSVNNRWVYQNSSEASYGGGVILSGPRSSGSLGSELTLTSGRIAKSAGGDHLNDSNITDDGTTVTVLSNTVINGTIVSTGTTIVSGSSQITFGSIGSIPSGLVSGSAQITLSSTIGYGSVINQAVLTTSTPTFSTVSATTFTGALSGNATTATTAGALTSMNISQFTNNSAYLTGITSGNVTTALGFTPYNATNPSGYISSITSGNVTTALGYTPYNATNPSGYISSITSGNVTTALGFTPYNATNPSGYITGISFANVSSKPTTLSGYGITDSVKSNGTITGNIDSDWGESFTTFDPVPSGTPPLSSPNIRTVNIGNNFDRRTQLAFDYASDVAYFRRRNDSGWQTWREFIHSGNIGSQTVATAGALSSMNISQFTNNSAYLTGITSGNVTTALGYTPYNATNPSGYISSITSGNVTTALGFTPYNATNPSGYISSITSGNVTTALGYTPYNATNPNGYITGISFANVSSKPTTISGYGITDAITTGNIGSQSVSYASTAGTAGNITAYTINQSVGTGNSPTFVDLYARSHFIQRSANTTHGINWYSSGYTAWCQYMAAVNVASTGPTGNITSPAAGNFVTSWALRSFIENSSGYGWTWEAGTSTGQPSIVAEMSSATGNFYTKGSITVGGIFTENSSIRYKTNIETIKYGLDKILQMRGVTYTRKDSGNIEAGVIAEEMYDVTPLVVLKNKDGEVDSVSYGRINAYLIEAVKELKQEINEQNLIITELKGKLGL
jgi:hypothetical protein